MILKLKDGDVIIELFNDIAPNHVERFIKLSSENKYDGVESTSISIFNSQTKPYNIKRDLVDVEGGIAYLALVRQGTETFEPERVAKWVSIAKLNGYADKYGNINPTQLLAFLMDYEAKIRAMGE